MASEHNDRIGKPGCVAFRAVRAVMPAIKDQIEQLIDRRFSFDACTARAGFGDLCNLHEPRGRSLSSCQLGGHTVWFAPSTLREFQSQLQHYRSCKRQRPDTAACILLPAHVARKAAPLLVGMQQVHRFAQGTPLFNGLDVSGKPSALTGIPYAADLWYDSPVLTTPISDSSPFISVLLLAASALAGEAFPL